jgi:hypothetical protein
VNKPRFGEEPLFTLAAAGTMSGTFRMPMSIGPGSVPDTFSEKFARRPIERQQSLNDAGFFHYFLGSLLAIFGRNAYAVRPSSEIEEDTVP